MMHNFHLAAGKCIHLVGTALLFVTLASCQSATPGQEARHSTGDAAAIATPATKPAPVALPTIRINAGASEPLTDSHGVHWAADTGFDGGDTIDRDTLQVTGTDTPELYRSEHFGMNAYSVTLPNGDYVVKLHFSEDYDGIASPAERVFSYAIKDGPAAGKTVKEVKNFSPWKAAGAQFKAYVDTVPVHVTQGAITITFTPDVENPQINAIEITPQ